MHEKRVALQIITQGYKQVWTLATLALLHSEPRHKCQGSVYVIVVHTLVYTTYIEPEDVRITRQEAFLLALQQHATAMVEARMSAANIQELRKGSGQRS